MVQTQPSEAQWVQVGKGNKHPSPPEASPVMTISNQAKHFPAEMIPNDESTAHEDNLTNFPTLNTMVINNHKNMIKPMKKIVKPLNVPADIEKLAREIEEIGNVKVSTGKAKKKQESMSPKVEEVQQVAPPPPMPEVPRRPKPERANMTARVSCARSCGCGIPHPEDEAPPNGETMMPTVNEELQAEVKTQLNLLFSSNLTEVNAVSKPGAMKWIKVPIAMDSGSMANVTPPGIFSCIVQATEASKRKDTFHGADNSPILNLGSQSVSGKSDSDIPVAISVDFEVANISRPLGSVSKLVRKQNMVVFDEDESYIKNKRTGEKVQLREENGLFYLDVWVEVPKDMELNPSFARQVAQ